MRILKPDCVPLLLAVGLPFALRRSAFARRACLFLIPLLLFLCSCGAPLTEERHPLLIRAENLRNGGKVDDALTIIELYLKRFPDSPKAHLRAAELLHEKGDYVMTIYHYRRYLAINPNAADKDLIPKWIQSVEKELAASIAETAPPPSALTTDTAAAEISRLSREADSLRTENAKLAFLAESLKHPPAALKKIEELPLPQTSETTDTARAKTAKKTPPPHPKPPPSEEKKQYPTAYMIKDGDTLYMISKKMYGTTKHHNLILDANKALIPSPANLVIGQELKIPAPPPER